jgi:trans-aconitate methyltransferase
MWEPNQTHKNLFEKLFRNFNKEKKYKILDLGTGRTSLFLLNNQFPKSEIQAIVHPEDERKISGIQESIKSGNFTLKKVDIFNYSPSIKHDLVVSHLLLGEATKFSKEPFEKMVEKIFQIDTDYLIIIDILQDMDVDYRIILEHISKKGDIEKIAFEDKYIGILLKRKN